MRMPKPSKPKQEGRPPLQEGTPSVVLTIRVTPEQHAKFKRLGADWLRKAINRAKEPK
jgi:hypothetical protein